MYKRSKYGYKFPRMGEARIKIAARHANSDEIGKGGSTEDARRGKKKKERKNKLETDLHLDHRARRDDFLGCLVSVLLEVGVEKLGKLVDFIAERGLGGPAVSGVQQLAGHAGAGLGDIEVEDIVDLVLGLSKLAAVDGVEDGTSVLQRATLAAGGGASADPAGVEQPSIGLVLLDPVRKHLCIAHGVQGQEGLSEARREGCLRLCDTVLGTSHFGGVTRDEVEHGLLGRELGDRRQHTASITGEEDDVRGMVVAQAGDLGVLNVLNGVGTRIRVSQIAIDDV